MAKAIETVRIAFIVGGGAVLLQLPLLFVLLRSPCVTMLVHSSLKEPDAQRSFYNHSQLMAPASTPLPTPEQMSKTLPKCQGGEVSSAFRPLSNPSFAFVLFSAYRHTLESFHVLGITSVVVRRYEDDRPVYRCEWHPYNESGGLQDTQQDLLTAEAQMLYVRFDENGMTYVPAIVNCTFNQTVGADGRGGVLRLHVGRGPRFWDANYAVEEVFQESPNDDYLQKLRRADNASASAALERPHKYAFCGPPMYGAMMTEWIQGWLVYHHYLWEGKAHFYFYDIGGIDDAGREMLEPWIKAGLLTIVHAAGGEDYAVWYHNQLLFINDCIQRTKFTADWTFVHDLDEFLYIPEPNSIHSLLEENKDEPWMTFANLPGSNSHCRLKESPDDWPIERLLWHDKNPECTHDDEDPWMCVAAPGRRKYVVNPRKVSVSGVHRVALSEEGGIDFNGKIARVHHFHGALDPKRHVCGIPINITNYADPNSLPGVGGTFDDTLAKLVPKAKEFATTLQRNSN